MEIRIGVQNCSRELSVETDLSPEEIQNEVARALSEGTVLRLADTKGGAVCLPASALGYVEIGAQRKGGVGFGSI